MAVSNQAENQSHKLQEEHTLHTPGAERAFRSLVDLFPESSLVHFPDTVKNIIDNATCSGEMLEALEEALPFLPADIAGFEVVASHVRQAIRRAKEGQ